MIATCRSPDKSPDLAKLLDKHGQAPALALDTTNPASLLKLVSPHENHQQYTMVIFKHRAVNTVMTRHGKLDILLNNAGVATRYPIPILMMKLMIMIMMLGHQVSEYNHL